jgi:hypothetical protein
MKYFICLSFVFLLSSSFKSVDPNQLKVDVVHKGKTISVGPIAAAVHVLLHDDCYLAQEEVPTTSECTVTNPCE